MGSPDFAVPTLNALVEAGHVEHRLRELIAEREERLGVAPGREESALARDQHRAHFGISGAIVRRSANVRDEVEIERVGPFRPGQRQQSDVITHLERHRFHGADDEAT